MSLVNTCIGLIGYCSITRSLYGFAGELDFEHGNEHHLQQIQNYERSAEVYEYSSDACTMQPLVWAISNRMVDAARDLVAAGSPVDRLHENDPAPLIVACEEGQLEIVNMLLYHKATVSVVDRYGNTPLLIACRMGNSRIASTLLNAGAPFNQLDQKGWSPLRWACANRMSRVAIQMIEIVASCKDGSLNYSDLDAIDCEKRGTRKRGSGKHRSHRTCMAPNRHGMETLLLMACKKNLTTVAALLCNDRWSESTESHAAYINYENAYGDSAFTWACTNNMVSVARELLFTYRTNLTRSFKRMENAAEFLQTVYYQTGATVASALIACAARKTTKNLSLPEPCIQTICEHLKTIYRDAEISNLLSRNKAFAIK